MAYYDEEKAARDFLGSLPEGLAPRPLIIKRERETWRESLPRTSREEAYVMGFRRRYGTVPALEDHGRALLTALPDEATPAVIRHYFEMDDPWFVRRGHGISTLRDSLNVVLASLAEKTRRQAAQERLERDLQAQADPQPTLDDVRQACRNHRYLVDIFERVTGRKSG
jgi:hypothetical protein